jgi:hypothetical protein
MWRGLREQKSHHATVSVSSGTGRLPASENFSARVFFCILGSCVWRRTLKIAGVQRWIKIVLAPNPNETVPFGPCRLALAEAKDNIDDALARLKARLAGPS